MEIDSQDVKEETKDENSIRINYYPIRCRNITLKEKGLEIANSNKKHNSLSGRSGHTATLIPRFENFSSDNNNSTANSTTQRESVLIYGGQGEDCVYNDLILIDTTGNDDMTANLGRIQCFKTPSIWFTSFGFAYSKLVE